MTIVAQHPKTDKPRCDLSDTVGDCFRALLRVAVILDRSGQIERASIFWRAARTCKRYDELLTLARRYVEVTL